MDAAVIAAMIALPLSALLATIEIARASGAGRSAMFRFPMLAYMLILALGNVFTTFLAASTLHDNLPSTAPPWFWYVFIGVFGFEAILKRVNLTFSGIGVLSINDWITKARDSAVADAIEAGVQRDETAALRLAERLRKLPEQELNAHVVNMLGQGQVKVLDNAAANENPSAALVKALALAKADYKRALAISPA